MNSQSPLGDAKQQVLLEDAVGWRLLSILFECPSGSWHEMLSSLSSISADPELKEAAEAAQTEASEGLYHSIFGPGGPAPAREVSYHKSVEFGGLMSELARYYDAFGYQPETQEPGDHVAVEAGFVGYLCLKEAYAWACQDADRAAITADAAKHFIEDHLSNVAEPLAAALERSGVRYLRLAGQALSRRAGSSGRLE